jgi:hypothetical protein
MDAAVKAIEPQSSETTAAERQLELSLQQARYEVAHARRQYDAVDPTNRLVLMALWGGAIVLMVGPGWTSKTTLILFRVFTRVTAKRGTAGA